MKGKSKHLDNDTRDCNSNNCGTEPSPSPKLLIKPRQRKKEQQDSKTNGAFRICTTPPYALEKTFEQNLNYRFLRNRRQLETSTHVKMLRGRDSRKQRKRNRVNSKRVLTAKERAKQTQRAEVIVGLSPLMKI